MNVIIGYKNPIDLYNGQIPKGTMWHQLASSNNNSYCPIDNDIKPIYTHRNLPKEIVETWEPVYKTDYKPGEWLMFWSENQNKYIISQLKSWTSNCYCIFTNGAEPFKKLIRIPTEQQIQQETVRTIMLSNKQDIIVNCNGVLAEGKSIKIKYIESLFCNTYTFGDTGYKIQYNTFDIGCYKNITREDLGIIIENYNEIKSMYLEKEIL